MEEIAQALNAIAGAIMYLGGCIAFGLIYIGCMS